MALRIKRSLLPTVLLFGASEGVRLSDGPDEIGSDTPFRVDTGFSVEQKSSLQLGIGSAAINSRHAASSLLESDADAPCDDAELKKVQEELANADAEEKKLQQELQAVAGGGASLRPSPVSAQLAGVDAELAALQKAEDAEAKREAAKAKAQAKLAQGDAADAERDAANLLKKAKDLSTKAADNQDGATKAADNMDKAKRDADTALKQAKDDAADLDKIARDKERLPANDGAAAVKKAPPSPSAATVKKPKEEMKGKKPTDDLVKKMMDEKFDAAKEAAMSSGKPVTVDVTAAKDDCPDDDQGATVKSTKPKKGSLTEESTEEDQTDKAKEGEEQKTDDAKEGEEQRLKSMLEDILKDKTKQTDKTTELLEKINEKLGMMAGQQDPLSDTTAIVREAAKRATGHGDEAKKADPTKETHASISARRKAAEEKKMKDVLAARAREAAAHAPTKSLLESELEADPTITSTLAATTTAATAAELTSTTAAAEATTAAAEETSTSTNAPSVSAARADVPDVVKKIQPGGEHTLQDKCMDIAGGNWKLVRHAPAGDKWHKAADQLRGTEEYGTPSDHLSKEEWSIRFDTTPFKCFLFCTGDSKKWLMSPKEEVEGFFYANQPRTISQSSLSGSPSKAKWMRRIGRPEDPWISLIDYHDAVETGDILYGGNHFSSKHATNVLPVHNGANVYIRDKECGPASAAASSAFAAAAAPAFAAAGASAFAAAGAAAAPATAAAGAAAAPATAATGGVCASLKGRPDACASVDGGGWQLVRHVPAGTAWHPAKDQLRGTEAYGNTTGGFMADEAWSKPFASQQFTEFLFASADCSKWLVAEKKEVAGFFYENQDRTIKKSSSSSSSTSAKWYRRQNSPEDPWISLTDHDEAMHNGGVLYGGNSYSSGKNGVLQENCGANVYIRTSATATTTPASRAPCDTYLCPTQYFPKLNAAFLKCAGSTCNSNDRITCCEPAANCRTYECPADYMPKKDADKIKCLQAECTEEDTSICCDEQATCKSFKCPDGLALKPGAEDFRCAGSSKACKASDCCHKDPKVEKLEEEVAMLKQKLTGAQAASSTTPCPVATDTMSMAVQKSREDAEKAQQRAQEAEAKAAKLRESMQSLQHKDASAASPTTTTATTTRDLGGCSGFAPDYGPLKGKGHYCAKWGLSIDWCFVDPTYDGPGKDYIKRSLTVPSKFYMPCTSSTSSLAEAGEAEAENNKELKQKLHQLLEQEKVDKSALLETAAVSSPTGTKSQATDMARRRALQEEVTAKERLADAAEARVAALRQKIASLSGGDALKDI